MGFTYPLWLKGILGNRLPRSLRGRIYYCEHPEHKGVKKKMTLGKVYFQIYIPSLDERKKLADLELSRFLCSECARLEEARWGLEALEELP